MTDPLLLTVIVLIVLVAAMVHGTVGFGFVLLAVPLMSVFIEPKLAVPVIVVQTLVTSVPILLHAYRYLRLRRMWLMTLAGVAGVPLGTLLLLVIDASSLRLVIGVVVVTAAVAMMYGFSKPLRHELMASAPVGFSSGVLGASTGLAGPPVIFFYTNQGLAPREFRANIVAYFAIMDLIILPSYVIGGLFTRDAIVLSAQLLPATLAGAIGGIILTRWVQEALFRRIALVLMVIAGVMAAISGISGLRL